MARYKAIDTSPRFLAVDLEKQLLPGSFEHAVHHLLDHEFDLSLFDSRYHNDQNGASAYPPGMLLKVILCAYAQGVVSSRGIERLCREHVICTCPAGKQRYRNGTNCLHNGRLATKYSGILRDCLPCEQRAQCLSWSIGQYLSVTYHIGSGVQQMTLPSLSSPSDEAWSADQAPLNLDMMRFRIVGKATAMEKLQAKPAHGTHPRRRSGPAQAMRRQPPRALGIDSQLCTNPSMTSRTAP
jgi:hypothetical protein